MSYKIGVDSGGTHVVACSYANNADCINKAVEGSGNILIDPAETVNNVSKAINEAALANETCEKILVGIAGLESASNIQPYLDQIKRNTKKVCPNIYFISDAKLALINGLEGEDGFLAIAGTGSIVYGKQNGKFLRIGGWGPLLDDIGSGYSIARSTIQQILHLFDLGKKSSLTEAAFTYFEVDSIPGLVSKYYKTDRAGIAGFSLKVAQQAEAGNADAIKILKDQGNELAQEILDIINRFSKDKVNYKLALSGSVLTKNKILRTELIDKVTQSYPQIKIIITTRNNSAAVNYF
ncbi:MAG: BadF/BadG/BcrA/BcrD ATPase family protein [Lactobacillus sp.]